MVLALRDKHYRALAGDGDVPKALLLQTAPRPRGDFRGSGAKTAFRDASSTPKSKRHPADKSSPVSRLSVPPATPSRDDVDGSGLSLPTSTPKKRKDGAFSLPTATPRRESLAKCAASSASAHRTASSKEVAHTRIPDKASNNGATICAGLCSKLVQRIRRFAAGKLTNRIPYEDLKRSSLHERRDAAKLANPGLATGKCGWVMPLPRYPSDHMPGYQRRKHWKECTKCRGSPPPKKVLIRRPEYFQKQSQSLRGTKILILARALAAWTEDARTGGIRAPKNQG